MTAVENARTLSASRGRSQIALASRSMQALVRMGDRFAAEKTFSGTKIGVCLHLTKETAVLVRALAAGGATVSLCGCNSFSTQDDVCAALKDEGVDVHARHGCSSEEYHAFLKSVAQAGNHIIIDDGADLTTALHALGGEAAAACKGGTEQTTSGCIRLRNMAKAGELGWPVVMTNDNKTKHLLDNCYGTGQSTWDGILRCTTAFVAGKTVCVLGYGECGNGIARRAMGLGAKQVLVCEVHPFAALKAVYDGYDVVTGAEAAPRADFFITATGSKSVVTASMAKDMKDGAYICNVGQFANEVDLAGIEALASNAPGEEVRPGMRQLEIGKKSVFILGGCNLVNLACAEGHPSEVMVTSFMGQALACEYLLGKGRCGAHAADLGKGCHMLPEELDDEVAALQLAALGVAIDVETAEQVAYRTAWEEGTA